MTRARLPNRRRNTFIDFQCNGVPYTACFANAEDGTLAEVFLNGGKEGSAADIIGRECAVVLSIALQFGTPLNIIVDALPKLADGNPAGPVGMALKLAVAA